MDKVVVNRNSTAVLEGPCESEASFSRNSLHVLKARYLKKDERGRCTETPEELFRRVARAIAEAESLYSSDPEVRGEWEQRFYSLMISRKFMPNSPTLMNAGREMGMLSACFVLPVGDSINEIFDSIKYTALIQKAGGGTGFAFDELRPTGDYIRSSGGTTSGPISFWRAFSEATNAIQQGAFRRGANMGMMNIHHPDILKFLYAKEDLSQFTNYNISVKITDEWMDAFLAQPDAPHVVRNPRTARTYLLPKDLDIWTYDIRTLVAVTDGDTQPTGEFYTRRDLWDIIITNAHRTGEPGVAFMDRINQDNPTPHVGMMKATNPCGEQPLLPFEACNLGSINLAEFVRENDDGEPDVDWDALRVTVHDSIRFLDDVIDANQYPLPQIDRICKANRKIGLGVMGLPTRSSSSARPTTARRASSGASASCVSSTTNPTITVRRWPRSAGASLIGPAASTIQSTTVRCATRPVRPWRRPEPSASSRVVPAALNRSTIWCSIGTCCAASGRGRRP